jgi:hypothetical protein
MAVIKFQEIGISGSSESPLAPLNKGGIGFKVSFIKRATGFQVPLWKGDLGGYWPINVLQWF